MNIVDRVKRLCVAPGTEWPVIEQETTPAGSLFTGYVLPLAALSAVAGFIGGSLVGYTVPFLGTYRVPLLAGLASAILSVVLAGVGVFVLSIIINALAPTFGAEKNDAQALKVAAYSFTPAWIAGVFQIVPALAVLVVVGGLYGLYLLYLGLPRLMKCPQDRAVSYTAVVVVCAIAVSIAITLTTGAIVGVGALGAGALSGAVGDRGSATGVEFDKDSPIGKLEELGRGLEESARKMEAAEKSGDPAAQIAAATEGLGALFGGGTRVEPLEIEQLKSFVPETFAGLPRTRSSAEKTGLGLSVSKAEAAYGEGTREVELELLDTGGVSGLMGLASWMGVQGEREDDDGSERTRKVGDRMVHEKVSKRGGINEYAIVIGNRFVVSAKGRLDVGDLSGAVEGLDLARLEAMKSAGVQK